MITGSRKNKDFILEKFSEKSLQQDVLTLFKGKQLLKLEGFTDDLTKLLHDNNFDSISGIQAFKITKTFILELYEPAIKDIINTVIWKAFSVKKNIRKNFQIFFLPQMN